MANVEVSERAAHLRSVTIVTVSSAAGIVAAVISAGVTSDLSPAEAATAVEAYALVLLFVLIQIPVYRLIGYKDFEGTKDILFITFMTFCFWFITYAVILSTGAQIG